VSTTIEALAAGGNTGRAVSNKSEAGSADRFLKLLVAQMQNQDPLNPLDNAQVTSQMAQIQTVSGIDKLNRSIESMAASFGQMQALQGATLVGRDVVVEGNKLSVNSQGVFQGGFEIDGAADGVTVEILSGAGVVIDTLQLGAHDSGRGGFDWLPRQANAGHLAESFRVVARSGAAALAVTPLMRDRVEAVVTGGDGLVLELSQTGSVPYSAVKAFN
jgi:flagellar basal-body rod modification protein FlgD